MNAYQIIYQTAHHYVIRGAKFFEIYRMGATAATRCGAIGFNYGIDRCKAECDRREQITNS